MKTWLLLIVASAAVLSTTVADPQSDDTASKARARRMQQEADAATAAEASREPTEARIRIIRIEDRGLWVSAVYADPLTSQIQRLSTAYIVGKLANVAEGQELTLQVRATGTRTFQEADGSTRTFRKFELVTK